LGGTFDVCAWLAKKALLRDLGTHNPEPELAKLEDRLLEAINKTGIGPQGLGGRTTALGVMVEAFPCHLASLPLAININCHAARHKTAVL
jgi:fumarate hydratase subunit alpha